MRVHRALADPTRATRVPGAARWGEAPSASPSWPTAWVSTRTRCGATSRCSRRRGSSSRRPSSATGPAGRVGSSTPCATRPTTSTACSPPRSPSALEPLDGGTALAEEAGRQAGRRLVRDRSRGGAVARARRRVARRARVLRHGRGRRDRRCTDARSATSPRSTRRSSAPSTPDSSTARSTRPARRRASPRSTRGRAPTPASPGSGSNGPPALSWRSGVGRQRPRVRRAAPSARPRPGRRGRDGGRGGQPRPRRCQRGSRRPGCARGFPSR